MCRGGGGVGIKKPGTPRLCKIFYIIRSKSEINEHSHLCEEEREKTTSDLVDEFYSVERVSRYQGRSTSHPFLYGRDIIVRVSTDEDHSLFLGTGTDLVVRKELGPRRQSTSHKVE